MIRAKPASTPRRNDDQTEDTAEDRCSHTRSCCVSSRQRMGLLKGRGEPSSVQSWRRCNKMHQDGLPPGVVSQSIVFHHIIILSGRCHHANVVNPSHASRRSWPVHTVSYSHARVLSHNVSFSGRRASGVSGRVAVLEATTPTGVVSTLVSSGE